jgi:PAS domain S-box-containing protein
MNEVSCRAFSYFQEAERVGWVRLDDLLDGLRSPRSHFEDPRNRVDWDEWARLCDRYADLVGEERLRASAGFARSKGFSGEVGRISALFFDPAFVYRAAIGFVAPSLYRAVRFTLTAESEGSLVVEAVLQDGYRPSRAWFQMFRDSLVVVPQFIGLPEAVVEGASDERSARCRVVPPPGRSVWLTVRRLWATIAAPRALVAELSFQQEQLRATLLAREAKDRALRDTLAHLPAMVGLHDGVKLTYANRALQAALGISDQEHDDRPLLEWIAAEDRERFATAVMAGSADEVLVRLDGAGGQRWAQVRAIPPVDDGGRQRSGFFAIDVTEERAAREALRHQDETLRAMSTALPDLVLRVDDGGNVVDLLGAAWEVDGTDDRFWRGRPLERLVGSVPHLTREHVEQLVSLTRDRDPAPVRLELGTGTSTRVLDWTATSIPGQREWLLVGRDVTARSRAERQLAEVERMASLGTLAAGVGHEINNPLASVAWNLDVLLDGLGRLAEGRSSDLDELRSAAADARHAADRIKTIVRHLKRFTRLDPPTLHPVDLAAAVNDAVAITANELQHRARLELRLGALPPVRGDADGLVQVFTNLLVNAAQAFDDSATTDRNLVRLTADVVGDEVVVKVTDNGRGIPAENLSRVFDPFFTTREPGAGTGLGLSIALGLLQDAGGHLTVESTVGQGTTISVHLRPAEPLPVPTPAAAPAPAATRLRLLVVDDEPQVLRALSRQLSTLHDVTTAAGADEACARIAGDGPFDVVVCDLHMPARDGLDVLAWARVQQPDLAERFVFLTGGAFTPRSQAFVANRRNRVLEKPVDRDHLRRVIEEVGAAPR